jgi:osmotically-inducible protein OsmY
MSTDRNFVSHLLLKRGFPLSRRYVASADAIRRTDADGCFLKLTTEAVFALPNVRETRHDATTVVLSKRSHIALDTGPRMRLAGLRVSVDNVVTHLLAERQWPANSVRLVPIDVVTEISPWRFSTELSVVDFRDLPRYRSDRDVERALREALFANDNISTIDLKAVDLDVSDGIVTLTGNVRWPETVRDIDQTASSTQGVTGVDNQILDDRDIELQIATLLPGIFPALADSAEINSQLGQVTITGKGSGDHVSRTVESAVQGVAGVVSVTLDVKMAESVGAIAAPSEPGPEKVSPVANGEVPTPS